jgi:hypothetical protein
MQSRALVRLTLMSKVVAVQLFQSHGFSSLPEQVLVLTTMGNLSDAPLSLFCHSCQSKY